MVRSGATFESNTVNAAGEIDKHHIAHLGLTCFFNLLGWTIFVSQTGHCLINFIIISWQCRAFNRNSRQIRNGNFWHYLYHQLSNQILTIFIRDDVQTWLASQFQFIFFDSITSAIIQLCADNFPLHLIAKPCFYHSHRHFSGAKTRHICCLCHFFKACGDFAVQILRGQFQFIFERQTVLACFVDIHDFLDVLSADMPARGCFKPSLLVTAAFQASFDKLIHLLCQMVRAEGLEPPHR